MSAGATRKLSPNLLVLLSGVFERDFLGSKVNRIKAFLSVGNTLHCLIRYKVILNCKDDTTIEEKLSR